MYRSRYVFSSGEFSKRYAGPMPKKKGYINSDGNHQVLIGGDIIGSLQNMASVPLYLEG
jgi:hypothetical protein